MVTVGVVPARAGSVRCPAKNTRPFGTDGMSLLEIACAQAAAVPELVRVICSTDVPAEWLRAHELPSRLEIDVRPPQLRGSEVSIDAVLADLLARTAPDWDVVVLLNPTSPGRSADNIGFAARAAFFRAGRIIAAREHSQVALGCAQAITSPIETGAIYAVARSAWDAAPGVRPVGSARCEAIHPAGPCAAIDIDTETDFAAARAIWAAHSDGIWPR